MISYLKGTIAHTAPGKVVVEVAGIGYQVAVPLPLSDQLQEGQETVIHTFLAVREDAMQLYGFHHPDERELFTMLISVSGIGAKTALALLSNLTLPDLVAAVVGNRPKELAKAHGVGLKTAERLIVELKGKLSDWQPQLPNQPKTASDREEAMVALLALGYTVPEAQEALERVPAGCAEEDAIRDALLWLSKEL